MWERDPDAAPGVLQRFGGTLVDLGVEWLANDPGALDGNSRKGRAVRAVLHMLDGIDLEKTPPLDLPARLFAATLDSLAADPRLMTDDPAMAQLITVTGRAVSEAAADLVKQSRALPGTSAYREVDVTEWAEAVFRAAIGSGGRLMLDEPGRFLGVAAPKHQALVTEVGGTLLEVAGLLGNGAPTTGRLGLERVARAALDVVADHPDLLLSGDAKRLRPFLSAAAGHLAEQSELADLGAVPGVLAVLVDRARAAPELLWPAAADSDGKELAVSVALETVGRMIPDGPATGAWRPSFNALDIEDMVGFALDEIVADPGWLTDRGRALSPRFGQALEVTFTVLREKADRRPGRDTGLAIVKRVLRTVYLRPALMNMRDDGRPALADVLEAVVARVFSETVDVATANRLLRKEVIELVTGATLEAVADVAEDRGVRLPGDLEPKVAKALDAAAERTRRKAGPPCSPASRGAGTACRPSSTPTTASTSTVRERTASATARPGPARFSSCRAGAGR